MSYESDYFDLTFTEAISIDDFDALSNRPSYNGTAMTHSTNVPLVKAATWDAKYDKPGTGIPKTDLASAVQTSLTLVEGITATAAELNTLDGITANTQELNYTDGVTSNIQTQLNGKASSSHTHATTDIAGLTATATELNVLDGIVSSTTELNYVQGVTSAIQTQLNGKASTADVAAKMDATNPTGTGSFSLNRKYGTTVGTNSFAEGSEATASGYYSHAEGYRTTAEGSDAHAEGQNTISSGNGSHAEGGGTIAGTDFSHAEGQATTAAGDVSHAEGLQTAANSAYQHVQGKYNVIDGGSTYADIVGWGTGISARKNISALTTGGDLRLKGDLYTSCSDDSTGGTSLATSIAAKQDKAFKVTISGSGSSLASDKTNAEIYAAYQADKYVYAVYTNRVTLNLTLATVSSTMAAFVSDSSADGAAYEFAINIINDSVTGEEFSFQSLITNANKLAASKVDGLATVATSGSYNDLSDTPTIPSEAQDIYFDADIRGALNVTDVQSAIDETTDIIASAYDSTSAYAVGDYCLRASQMYRCNTAIASGGESWTASHWTAVEVGTEFASAFAQITNLNTDVTHIKDMTSAAEQAGTYAEYHLGFYLDENGDLCQLEED